MAAPVKTVRCALCGSSSVVYRSGCYYCISCGARGDHPMSDAALAYIDRALAAFETASCLLKGGGCGGHALCRERHTR